MNPRAYPNDGTVRSVDDSGSYLKWYAGAFDVAFIALHPFRDITGMREGASEILRSGGQPIRSAATYDIVSQLFEYGRGRQAFDWGTVEDLEKRHAKPIRWRDVASAVGLADIASVNRALLTQHSLKSSFRDPAGAFALNSWCDANAVFPPLPDDFNLLHEASFHRLFEQAGLSHIVLDNEFEEDPRVEPLSALSGDSAWRLPHDGGPWRRLYASDRSLMAAVDFFDHYTVIAAKDWRLQPVDLSGLFEGFWCDAQTSHLWWLTDAERTAALSE